MKWLASFQFVLMCALSLLHVYWAFGGGFAMGKAVPEVDGRPAFEPGMFATLAVAAGLLVCALVAAGLGFGTLVGAEYVRYVRIAGYLLAALFILRAVGEFNLVGFFKKASDSAFAHYDTFFYSPLSLGIGIVFLLLALAGR